MVCVVSSLAGANMMRFVLLPTAVVLIMTGIASTRATAAEPVQAPP